MKKSKKALLWTIVPVLGVSSGVAGAVAGVTNQKTSVDTNNVATPGSATTMATKSSSKSASGLEIDLQPHDVLAISGDTSPANMNVHVKGATEYSRLRYEWKVNTGDGKWTTYQSSRARGHLAITIPKTNVLQTWTFRCVITSELTGKTIVSKDAKFTVTPPLGRYVSIINQPASSMTVSGGQEVVLTTSAKAAGKQYASKEIGYQWFKYDSEKGTLTEIEDAKSNEYRFTAPYTSSQEIQKYVCRYYFKDEPNKYLSESNQSIVTINKVAKEQVTFKNLNSSLETMKVGQKTTLSVEAESTISKNLKYQWYKLESDGITFKEISGADTQVYEYEAKAVDAGKKLTFMVMAFGVMQDNLQNYFQSDNLVVEVQNSSQTIGTVIDETFASKLSVSSSVTTNQASVRSNFYLNKGIASPEYTVTAKGVDELSYQWYYVGRNGKETLIEGANTNVLKPSADLLRKVYNDNSGHKVDIVCKISKGDTVIRTVDKKSNSRFYLGVVITNRRVSNL